jgi:predicted dehydrogenase
MRNGRYGCAVWGCGWVASGHINAYLRQPGCELVALGSRRPESVARKQAEFGLEATAYTDLSRLLADDRVDIVSLCTPNHLHAEETIQAARAGKHVFIEKPVATRAEDLRAMSAAVTTAGVRTLVGFVLRFNPLVNLQRRLVGEGELGRVFLLNVDYWFGRERLGWMKEQDKTGGAFILAGCHSVDMARYVLGADIVAVRGAAVQVGTHYDYPPVETAQVTFANGAIGAFTCSLEGCSPYTANLAVLGEKGTIRNDQFFLKRFQGQADYFTLDTGTKKSGDVYGHPFPAMVDHFVSCIREGRESPHNLADAANAHLACIAICQSAAQGGEKVRIEGDCLV